MKRRLCSLIMTAVMLLSLLPVTALTVAGDTIATGYCGSDSTANAQVYSFTDDEETPQQATYYDNATWALTANGTATDGKSTYKLTISGAGPMGDFFSSWSYGRPWLDVIAKQNQVELTATKPYITELEIQDGITEIGERAFAGFTGISKIMLPDTVTVVADGAFNGCNQVESIDFSENLLTIEHVAFGNMTELESIDLPNSLVTIGVIAFEGAGLTGDLVIPDGVKTIGNSAFPNCTGLTGSLTIGKSVESIGDGAFGNCRFTGTLTIPDSVQYMGSSVFNSCQFSNLVLGNGLCEVGPSAFNGVQVEGKLVIPDPLTDIGEMAFYGKQFTSVQFSQYVRSVGKSAFSNTTTIHSLDLSAVPDDITYDESAFASMANPNIVYVNGSDQIEKVSAALTYPDQRTSFAVTKGGVFPVATEFEEGKLATPVRDGYHFVGWYTEDGTDGDWGEKVEDSTALQTGSTYYAQWAENVVTDVPEEVASVEFGDITYGEGAPTARSITLDAPEEGDTSVTITDVSCNSDAFEVKIDNENALAVTVTPKEELNAGEYTGTVCVYTEVKTGEENPVTTTPTYWFTVSMTVEKKDSPISFDVSSVSKEITDGPFTVDLDGVAEGAAVTYTSSDPNVAVVYSSGLVTIRGAGTVTITATADETLNYNSDSTSFALTVIDPADIPSHEDDDIYDDDTPSHSEPSYSPKLEISDGGDIKLSHRTPEEDEEVTITVRPDRGYELDRIAVYDRNGDRLDLDRTDDDSYTFIQPRGRVTIQVIFVEIVAKPDLPFRDVDVDDWFYDAVVYAYENGLMSGTGETTFSPNGTTTRGQIVTILWRLAGSPQVNYLMDFSDVDPAAWYGEAVRWASSLRIASGYGDGRFGPDDPITREQLAVMLYQYAWNMGYDLAEGGMALREFADYEAISPYALEALDWAVNAGIISGTGDSALSPQGRATRAQTAVMLQKFCELDK